jgi:hypothetical protein
VLDLTFVTGQSNWRVELGRILRGHRFSHEPLKSGANTDHTAESVNLIFASQIMEQVAPVSAVDGTYRISAEDNSIVALGLLGKLHPQNVILRSGQPWSDVVSSGKQFGSRFVIENFDPSSDCHCSS